MRLISKRLMILNAPHVWRARHLLPDGRWRGAAKGEAYQRLMALDLNTASMHAVNEAMGFNFLTPSPPCDVCGRQYDAVVELTFQDGEERHICHACTERALKVLGNGAAIPLQ